MALWRGLMLACKPDRLRLGLRLAGKPWHGIESESPNLSRRAPSPLQPALPTTSHFLEP